MPRNKGKTVPQERRGQGEVSLDSPSTFHSSCLGFTVCREAISLKILKKVRNMTLDAYEEAQSFTEIAQPARCKQIQFMRC